jgi:prepilin-type N-terminal cleavage/methylation domain-containing protein/prepilin-type processing-associated H-X9-DG protein
MLKHSSPRHARPAFTLIELLVVISIISLLVAILLPVLAKARETTRQVICGTQENQLNLAALGYATDNKYWFPMVRNSAAYVHTHSYNSSRVLVQYLNGDMDKDVTKAVSKVMLCPNRDPAITEDYVDINNNRLGSTYQFLASRGDRNTSPEGTDSNDLTFQAIPSVAWYGWQYQTDHITPYNNAVYRMGPIPRETLVEEISHVGPVEQPIISDLYWYNSTVQNMTYGAAAVRSNHPNGSNIGYLDGHVKFINSDHFTKYIRYYSSLTGMTTVQF